MAKITDGQKFALVKLCSRFSADRHERLWLLSRLIKRKVETTSDVEKSEWQKIRDWAYPNWTNDNWEIGQSFAEYCSILRNEYETDVIGQQRLF